MFLRIAFFGLMVLLATAGFAAAADTDGDGLTDDVEARLGSNPRHKDIFVEIDYLIVKGRNLKPRPAKGGYPSMVNFVTGIFASAPVNNPDGKPGINIHIEVSQGIKSNKAVLGYCDQNGYNWGDFDQFKNAYFSQSKWQTHHYCLFAMDWGDENGQPSGSSGISRNGTSSDAEFRKGASDLIVSLGGNWWNQPNSQWFVYTQAGTFTHELGHNLGLRHGGIDHTNYKPNFLSIMTYAFQTDGIPFLASDGSKWRIWDYSRMALPVLNEANLNEWKGLGPKVVTSSGIYGTHWFVNGNAWMAWAANKNLDWNGDGYGSSSVASDINGDGSYSKLKSFFDWPSLVYTGGWVGGPGREGGELAELPRSTKMRCLTFDEAVALRRGTPIDWSRERPGTFADVEKIQKK